MLSQRADVGIRAPIAGPMLRAVSGCAAKRGRPFLALIGKRDWRGKRYALHLANLPELRPEIVSHTSKLCKKSVSEGRLTLS